MPFALANQRLRARRIATGLTIHALADRLGLHAELLWAIEDGREDIVAGLPLAALVALADALDLLPGDLFTDRAPDRTLAEPDDVTLEAALLQHGSRITRDALATILGWSTEQFEQALVHLDRRLQGTGSRLHRLDHQRSMIEPYRRALSDEQWALLAQTQESASELTPEASTLLHALAFSGRRLRCDTWDDTQAGLRQLREQHLLEGGSRHFRLADDVVYSLRLDEERLEKL